MRLVQLFEDQPHQRYVSGILEGPQGGVLYHATDIMSAMQAKVMPFPGPVRYVNPRKQGAAAIPG